LTQSKKPKQQSSRNKRDEITIAQIMQIVRGEKHSSIKEQTNKENIKVKT
jgi:hypothetical protein